MIRKRSIRALRTSVLTLASGLTSHAALAQSVPTTDSQEALETVIVTGTKTFLSADTSGATGLPLPIEQVPQSISLVSSDFIKAADLRTAGDVANYTPGMLNAGSEEGSQATVKLRGFGAGNAVDGLSADGGFDPDYAVVDRLEVVKGPASVIYGISNAGGLINRVTKSGGAGVPTYLSLEGGSWSNYRLEGQISRPLDAGDHLYGIAIGAADTGNSFQDFSNHTDYVAYAGINANYDEVSGFLHVGYERHLRTSFDGIPTFPDGSAAPVPRSFFIGTEHDKLNSNVAYLDSDLTWHSSDVLEFSLKGLVQWDRTTGIAPYSYGMTTDGTISLAIQNFMSGHDLSYGAAATTLYKLDNLGLKDSFVTAAVVYQGSESISNQGSAQFPGSGTANIYDGDAAISSDFASATLTGVTRSSTSTTKTPTLMLQSILKPLDPLSVLVGASYSKPTVDAVNSGVLTDLSPSGKMSYRGGLTWEVVKGMDLYGSYSQSFQPNTRFDINNKVLPPVSGEQYEFGAKYRTLDGKLLLTAAAYKLSQSNSAQYAGQNPSTGFDYYRAAGEVTNKGIELEALGHVTRQWQISAGYSYLDSKITEDSNPELVGKTSVFLPKNTFSLFSTYTLDSGLLSGLFVGGGLRYLDNQPTSYDGSTRPLPSYAVLDLTLGYLIGKYSVQLNVKNLADKYYFYNNYDSLFYGNAVGAPRSFMITLSHNF